MTVIRTARDVVPLRASETEKASWIAAAEAEGLKFSPWAREMLNQAARNTERVPPELFRNTNDPVTPKRITGAEIVTAAEVKRLKSNKRQTSLGIESYCDHRNPLGKFCPQCGA